MPRINPATMLKLKAQRSDAISASIYKAMASSHLSHRRDSKYWVVNTHSNKRSETAVTLDEFIRYLGPKATLGVMKLYKLYPAG